MGRGGFEPLGVSLFLFVFALVCPAGLPFSLLGVGGQ